MRKQMAEVPWGPVTAHPAMVVRNRDLRVGREEGRRCMALIDAEMHAIALCRLVLI